MVASFVVLVLVVVGAALAKMLLCYEFNSNFLLRELLLALALAHLAVYVRQQFSAMEIKRRRNKIDFGNAPNENERCDTSRLFCNVGALDRDHKWK